MTQKIYVDRSRYEQYGRCPRSRYLQYHFAGTGIESSRKPLPLAVGGSVHVGLAELLRRGEPLVDHPYPVDLTHGEAWNEIEESAVAAALADFAQFKTRIELPDAERAMPGAPPPPVASEIDEYLFAEQSALVEAMVRAYARRRLRPLLEQFEVLEVEREGEWLLSEWTADHYDSHAGARELWFMSRPDALLRERESNQLYLLSYKTAASWDVRKARDAEHDMQGMSEGIEIERRLAEWWQITQHVKDDGLSDSELANEASIAGWGLPDASALAMVRYLRALDTPPRILAVRYEYMLKGERWKDRELSERFGVEMRSQKSHLIRRYEAVSTPQRGTAGYDIGDSCWSWDYIREDGRDGSLAWQNWKSRAVFQAVTGGAHVNGGVKAWIDALDDAAEAMSGEDSTMGLEPRLLGYKCGAQALGVTREHPLDAIFISPIHVYRNDDELRDLVDQMEAVERRIAEGAAEVERASREADDGEVRHQLNVYFPQTRRACSYPTQCQFVPVCYGGEDIRRDPVASGLYTIRTANHKQEMGKEMGKEMENKNV